MAGSNQKFTLQIDNLDGVNKIKTSLKELSSIKTNESLIGMEAKDVSMMLNSINVLDAALTRAFDKDLGVVNIQKFNQYLQAAGTDINQIQMGLSLAGVKGQQAFMKTTGELLKMGTVAKQTHTLVEKFTTSFKEGINPGI